MPSKVETEWHAGELAVHSALKLPARRNNPTAAGLPQRYHWRIAASPFMALGVLDDHGRPWTTLWGGEAGFAQAVAENVIGVNSGVSRLDPVFEALWGGESAGDGSVVEMGRLMSGLAVDLGTRDRVKLMGEAVAGAVVSGDEGDRVQLAFHIAGSLGNCPKYITKREVVPRDTRGAELVPPVRGLQLGDEALALLASADMFFLSTTDGESMDTNIRGGKPGFVRVARNEESGLELVYPEYSGNRLYQSLGNMSTKPLAGIVVPDYETGNVLYLTGTTHILIGKQASSLIARSNLAVRIQVVESRLVRGGLPFCGVASSPVDYSPYNPPLRYLTDEKTVPTADAASDELSALLVKREALTPTVSRFTFQLSRDATWKAGQHVTLDFEPELSNGYAHMNDADPQSLNDDFVRTFTISSAPLPSSAQSTRELQITVKRHGPATALLMRHNLRVPLELRVMGFGGKDEFHLPTIKADGVVDIEGDDVDQGPVFIAGGVGITPVLAQGRAVLESGSGFRLLWTLRSDDLPLARDTFQLIPGLARRTKLFVTGGSTSGSPELQELESMGASVETRRLQEGDLVQLRGHRRKYYLCAPAGLIQSVNTWLDDEDVVWEDFGY